MPVPDTNLEFQFDRRFADLETRVAFQEQALNEIFITALCKKKKPKAKLIFWKNKKLSNTTRINLFYEQFIT